MIEDKDFVDSCMKNLTNEEREFVKYRYYEEKSQKESSEIMGTSQMQISRMEKKVLKKFRTMYFKD